VRLDTYDLIRRGEEELAAGDPLANKTLQRARRELLKQRDVEGLDHLLDLAGRLDDGGKLTYSTQQNIKFLTRQAELDARPASLGRPRSPTSAPRRSSSALGPPLGLHAFGACTWVAFLGFSADIGSTRQFYEALAFGAATWLVAAALIVLLWWYGKSERWTLVVPFVWWYPSYILMVYVVY
jgi:hypothetical protein